jgi:hypothetical protein
VYEYYASQLGVPLQMANPDDVRDSKSRSGGVGGPLARSLRYLKNNKFIRERLTFLLAFLSPELNNRIYLRYLQTRARTKINALRKSHEVELCEPDWRELKVHPVAEMPAPATLMDRYPLRCTFGFSREERREENSFPAPHLLK